MRDRTRYTFEEFLLGNLLSVMVFLMWKLWALIIA